MPNILTWLAGPFPACLMNAATWIYHHPLAVELMALIAIASLAPLEALRG